MAKYVNDLMSFFGNNANDRFIVIKFLTRFLNSSYYIVFSSTKVIVGFSQVVGS